jgi:flagella basal body P-ring formation protein FlgA
LSGESLVDHRFSGAPEVRIGSAEAATTAPKLTPKVAKHTRSQLTARIERAIAQHLQQAVDDRVAWQVTLEISPEQIATLAGKSAEIVAVGGKEPWTGDQSFTLQARGAGGSARLYVNAHVRLPDMVVVAKRPFRRGEVVRAVDVELQAPATSNAIALATRIEDVVGRETTRSVATGQPLEESWLRQPIMVRRGEIVTVYARAANLLVRTQARATEDGGRDEVVVVERLDNRQRYSARVVGVQELEVLVGGVKVGSTR